MVTLSYDGTNYCGWQVQPNGVTIQEKVECALARIFGIRVRVTASGRTDSGVHALGQVASFSVDTKLSAEQLHRAINGSLPPDIRVVALQDAPPGFHAIREARSKHYRYQFWDAPQHDVFQRLTHWHVRTRLNEHAMQQAAEYLIGTHDFASFQAAGSPRASTVRTVTHLSVSRNSNVHGQVVMAIEANGYLYNMVRNIAGSLVEVGRGVNPPDWIRSVVDAKDRRLAGPTAPAHGLILVSVEVDLSGTRPSVAAPGV